MIASSAEPSWTVLCVDDEPNILAAIRRAFRRTGYKVLIADGGEEALQVLEDQPVHLVISDMRMPRMDGAQLLEIVRRKWPAITRILLTGHADVASTVAAINRGEIFRYIAKPWNEDELLLAAHEGLERQALVREKARLERVVAEHNDELERLNGELEQKVQLRTAELSDAKEQLDRNYMHSITALSNLMEMRGGAIAGHSRRVADLARRIALRLGMKVDEAQDVFVAGLLHDIGEVGLSDDILACPVARMSGQEKAQYARHAALGEQALLALQDMHRVAALVRSHHERHDGLGFPDRLVGAQIPIGARILAIADTFDDLQREHLSRASLSIEEARLVIGRGSGGQFDPAAINAFLEETAAPPVEPSFAETAVAELRPGMVLAHDLRSREGVVLLAAGYVLDGGLIQRISAYASRHGLALQIPIQTDIRHRPAVLPFRTLA